MAIEQTISMEHLRPGATGLLLGPGLGIELQEIGGGGGLPRREAMQRPRHINSAQHLLHALARVGLHLAEDEHTGMVVNAEGLLGRRQVHHDGLGLIPVLRLHQREGILLVGELERAEGRVGGEVGDQLEAQFTGEERAVVLRRQGIAGPQAGDRSIESVAGQKDVVGLVEPGEQLLSLPRRVLVVVLHLDPPVHPAEGIVPVHP